MAELQGLYTVHYFAQGYYDTLQGRTPINCFVSLLNIYSLHSLSPAPVRRAQSRMSVLDNLGMKHQQDQ